VHQNNIFNSRYDIPKLVSENEALAPFITKNKVGEETIDFSNKDAVFALNKAILNSYFSVQHFELPEDYLIPPIPGRLDYLLYLNDLLPKSKNTKILDIGTGASCIYPLLGHAQFSWDFVATEYNETSLKFAKKNIKENGLEKHIELRKQYNKKHILKKVTNKEDHFAACVCNPPFFKDKNEMQKQNDRKWKQLGKKPHSKQNFGGVNNELWYDGGEVAFISQLITESQVRPELCKWFTTLVSSGRHLSIFLSQLEKLSAKTRIIDMELGQKKTRILCWSFL